MEQEKKEIHINNYKSLSTTLNGFNFKDITFSSIALFVGQNGTGKTVILILSWIINAIAAAYFNSAKSPKEYEDYLQFLIDNSFSNCDFTGDTEAVFENFKVRFTLDNGKVTNLDFEILDKNIAVKFAGVPVFMSKATRLFSEMSQYFKVKKMLKLGDLQTFTEQNWKDLMNVYKVYDVMFMERMQAGIKNPNFKLNPKAAESFKEIVKKDIKNITFDDNISDYVIHEEVSGVIKTYPASNMSAGEQAWVNIFVNSTL